MKTMKWNNKILKASHSCIFTESRSCSGCILRHCLKPFSKLDCCVCTASQIWKHKQTDYHQDILSSMTYQMTLIE